ncbi:MAG TPA: glycosyltransferase family 87 protein [Candidatus Omnitrophota bacterium]|nr:glycosyltransferase family 87 protein [Candidatus Omnitrophota bacterium]
MAAQEIKKNWRNFTVWITAGLALRAVMMLAAAHNDIIFINFFPSKMAYSGILDIYGYIAENFPPGRSWNYYPPLTYVFFGVCQMIFKPVNPGFYPWIQDVFSSGLREWLLTNGTSLSVFRYLIIMKSPYLIFDGLCLFCIMNFLKSWKTSQKALKLWCLSPVVLYGAYMFGQFDIIPASLTVFSLLLMEKKRIWQAFFILSLAALFKTFTIFMILPLLIVTTDSKKSLLKSIAAVLMPFVFVLLPFYVLSGEHVVGSIFPKFYSGIRLDSGFAFEKIIFLVLYPVFIANCLVLKKRGREQDIVLTGVSSLMLVYTVFYVPVHYFIWVTPLLILAVCRKDLSERIYWAQVCTLFIYNLNSPGTTTGLLMPVDPSFFGNLPGLPDIMHGFSVRWGGVMLVSRMIFLALCVIVAAGLSGGAECFKKVTNGGINERS